MKYKEKLTIAISLSLGFMYVRPLRLAGALLTCLCRAGICGIIRTIELGGLSSANYTGKSLCKS